MRIDEVHGVRVLVLDATGDPVSTPDDAADLVGSAWSHRAELVAVSAVDESGARLFDLNGDIEHIRHWPYPVLKRVSDVVVRRNKIGADAVEDAKKN